MKKTKKTALFLILFISIFFILRQNDLIYPIESFIQCNLYKVHNMKNYAASLISPSYKKNKEIIHPYFDEEWYKKQYAENLEQSGLSPIDHYLQRGWTGNWKHDCDPAPWFNVTVYKEMFPCYDDPFVNFLIQQKNNLPENAKTIILYANETEFFRAWIAVEKLLRLNTHHVLLFLPENFEDNIPPHFKLQAHRGLEIKFTSEHISFYQSNFLKSPDNFSLSDMKAIEADPTKQKSYSWPDKITRIKFSSTIDFHWHELFLPSKSNEHKINPVYINIGNLTDEPVLFWKKERDIEHFKKYVKRIAPMYDLFFTGVHVDGRNIKVVPGYMATWVDEMPSEKEFSVSFLLSKFKTKVRNSLYDARLDIFKNFKNIENIQTRFYVSRRMIDKYPKELQQYVLPTDSKIWIFKSMFNIAIENIQQENYFTEKLLGCFESLTVPIYFGCPNISDYFDPRGMIIVHSLDELKNVLQKLTPELYEEMLPFLKKNKEKVQHFIKLKESYVRDFFSKITPPK